MLGAGITVIKHNGPAAVVNPAINPAIDPPPSNNTSNTAGSDMTTYIFIAAAILAAAYFIKN